MLKGLRESMARESIFDVNSFTMAPQRCRRD
jgi:hypothetical protein